MEALNVWKAMKTVINGCEKKRGNGNDDNRPTKKGWKRVTGGLLRDL